MTVRLALAAGALAAASPAGACLSPDHSRALVLSALPRPLPRGAIVADVVMARGDEPRINRPGIVARVRRVHQGPRDARSLVIRQTVSTDCDWPFANGTSGIVVGKPVGRRGGMLVIEPVMVPKSRGYRLVDGYQFPPGFGHDHH